MATEGLINILDVRFDTYVIIFLFIFVYIFLQIRR